MYDKETIEELVREILEEIIVKVGGKYCLKSKKKDKKGNRKNLGCYDSKSGAEKREKQVNYFKYLDKKEK